MNWSPTFPLLRGGVAAPIKYCHVTLNSARPGRSNPPIDWNTTSSSRNRMLRDIFLSARPTLLAVMRGGEFAFLKMARNFDSSASGEGDKTYLHLIQTSLPGANTN